MREWKYLEEISSKEKNLEDFLVFLSEVWREVNVRDRFRFLVIIFVFILRFRGVKREGLVFF